MLCVVLALVVGTDGINYSNEVVSASVKTDKLYFDSSYGFSFRYSNDWIPRQGYIADRTLPVWEVRLTSLSDYYAAIVINVYPISKETKSVFDFIDSLDENNQYNSITFININKTSGLLVTNTSVHSAYMIVGELGYVISLQEYGDNPEHQKLPEILNSTHSSNLLAFNEVIESITVDDKVKPLKPTNIIENPIVALNATDFRKPLDNGFEMFGYAGHPTFWNDYSPCFGINIQNTYHLAEDWGGAGGTTVKAVGNGIVDWYDSSYSNWPGRIVIMRHTLSSGSTIYSLYGHLAAVYVSAGQSVQKGDSIGTILDQQGNSHLHWEMRSLSEGPYPCSGTRHEGRGYTYPQLPDQLGFYDPSNFVNNPPGGGIPCPESPGVILYYGAGFSCDNRGANEGYMQRTSAGWQNMSAAFNDQASSIKVQSGWSVMLYQHANRGGGKACRTADDLTFISDTFDNGVNLNGSGTEGVSSFEVFTAPNCGAVPDCPAPTLLQPANGTHLNTANVPFSWSSVGCSQNRYTLCIKDSPNIESGGQTIANVDVTGTQTTVSIPSQWHNRDLYWSVVPGVSGGKWAASRPFRVDPNQPPSIAFNTSNGNGASPIKSRDQNWTFQGTASDPEGQLNRVEARCEGDNCGSQPAATNSTSWSLQRNGMDGRNDVWFEAVDNANYRAVSRRVDLWIDRTPPETRATLNSSFTIQPWYQATVQVQLQAEDRGNGRAITGVKRIEYQVDSGAWQNQANANANFSVSGDGEHRILYWAVDVVDNRESTRGPLIFKIDQTAPTAPNAAAVNCAAVSNQWQKVCAAPTFTWAAASDATSGVAGYDLEFVNAQNVIMANPYRLANDRQFSFGALPTGSYTLRGRTRDVAGNVSAWTTMFILRYDGTAPNNPTNVSHAAGITSDVWQRITNVPNFSWTPPTDEGSGIKGYDVAWGSDPAASATTFQTANNFQSATPLCAANAACIGYLRMRSVDNVDNRAALGTAFVLRYDNAPPIANFTINQGITQTTQTQIQLNLASTDAGSGLTAMRISGDGYDWTAWEAYASERTWSIPAISRQEWPVYVQVRDGVGLESTVISRTIYLDVNAQQPRSLNFRLFNHVLSAGAGAHTSTSYRGRSTVGQPADSGRSTSASYTLRGGYESASQAAPLVVPGFERYRFINGIVASGSVTPKLRSPGYQMQATFGEPALPNNTTTIGSAGFRHQPGFLATLRWDDQTPARFRVSINELLATPISGTEFIELYNAGPDPAVLTNWKVDDTLAGGSAALTIPAGTTIPANGFWVLPVTNYLDASNDAVNLLDATGAVTDTYAYSTTSVGRSISRLPDGNGAWVNNTPPTRNAANQPPPDCEFPRISINNAAVFTASPSVTLSICAPAMVEMKLSNDGGFAGAQWEPYVQIKPWTLTTYGQSVLPRFVYAAFRDANGTIYATYFDDIIYDSTAPQGTITVSNGSPAAQTTNVHASALLNTTVEVQINARDDNSGMAQMQLSASAAFTDTTWQPFSARQTWLPTGGDGSKTVYVRLRDHAGNVSPVVSRTFTLDTQAPIGGVVFDQRVVSGEALTQTLYLGAGDSNNVIGMRLSLNSTFANTVWRPYTTTVTLPIVPQPEGEQSAYVQYQDAAGNVSAVYSDTFMVDTTPPELFVQAEQSLSVTRSLALLAYDELADLGSLRLSNDPLMREGVVTQPYTTSLIWTFDQRRVVWVQIADSVDNWSEPYPAYAEQPLVLDRRVYLPFITK